MFKPIDIRAAALAHALDAARRNERAVFGACAHRLDDAAMAAMAAASLSTDSWTARLAAAPFRSLDGVRLKAGALQAHLAGLADLDGGHALALSLARDVRALGQSSRPAAKA